MGPHHEAWLSAHPERTAEWLEGRLLDGFQVHHIDGSHENNDPLNLVLIESGDHLMLHNGKTRLLWRPKTGPRGPQKIRKAATSEHSRELARSVKEIDRLVFV